MGFLRKIIRFHILNMALEVFFSKVQNNFRVLVPGSGQYTGPLAVGQLFSEIRWIGDPYILKRGYVWRDCYIRRIGSSMQIIFFDTGDGRLCWDEKSNLEFYL